MNVRWVGWRACQLVEPAQCKLRPASFEGPLWVAAARRNVLLLLGGLSGRLADAGG